MESSPSLPHIKGFAKWIIYLFWDLIKRFCDSTVTINRIIIEIFYDNKNEWRKRMLHRCTKRKSLLADNTFNVMNKKIKIKFSARSVIWNNHISMKQWFNTIICSWKMFYFSLLNLLLSCIYYIIPLYHTSFRNM